MDNRNIFLILYNMNIQLPYTPKFSRTKIERNLSKNYFKKPYDRFMWWRAYTPKNKPLGSKAPLIDRLINGDYEMGPFLMEVELVYHTMNDKFISAVTTQGEVDHGKYHSETSIDRARRKRLIEDHEKDENRKLSELKKEFVKVFKMDTAQYDEEVIKTNGDLVQFYYEMESKYGKYIKIPRRTKRK